MPRQFTPRIVAGTDLPAQVTTDQRKPRRRRRGRDPIFAIIERHRILSDSADAATGISAKMFDDDPRHAAAAAVTDAAHCELMEHAELLFSAEPTTVAGVVALLRYLPTLDLWQTPSRDPDVEAWCGVVELAWFPDFCKALENAVARISVG
jgi:hypothetical protein